MDTKSDLEDVATEDSNTRGGTLNEIKVVSKSAPNDSVTTSVSSSGGPVMKTKCKQRSVGLLICGSSILLFSVLMIYFYGIKQAPLTTLESQGSLPTTDVTPPSMTAHTGLRLPSWASKRECTNGWEVFEDKCYFFSTEPVSLTDVQEYCQNISGAPSTMSLSNVEFRDFVIIHMMHFIGCCFYEKSKVFNAPEIVENIDDEISSSLSLPPGSVRGFVDKLFIPDVLSSPVPLTDHVTSSKDSGVSNSSSDYSFEVLSWTTLPPSNRTVDTPSIRMHEPVYDQYNDVINDITDDIESHADKMERYNTVLESYCTNYETMTIWVEETDCSASFIQICEKL